MSKRSASTIVLAALIAATLALPASAQDREGIGIVRAPNEWLLRDSPTGGPATTSFRYGASFDGSPMLCDWNGDGQQTPGVIRPSRQNSRWLLRNSLSGGVADHSFVYGRIGDMPVCGDWNGDGRDTPGVVRRRSDGLLIWHLRNELGGGPADVTFAYGRQPRGFMLARPVVGDWNGDGIDTPGVAVMEELVEGIGWSGRDVRWQLRDSNTGGRADHDFRFGGSFGFPIAGDWNGDGRDGPGLRDGSTWLLRNDLSDGGADREFRYGRASDGPHPLVW